MRRLSDVVGAKVQLAICALPIAEETKQAITWELTSAFIAKRDGGQLFTYGLTLCVPVPFTDDDFEAPMKVLADANPAQEEINEAVRELYAEARRAWTQRDGAVPVPEERTPGGLIKG